MKSASSAAAALAGAIGTVALAAPALAQVPYVEGTWKLNAAASRLPGPAPQSEVRSYRVRPDGVLVGLSVVVGPNGAPGMLMFAAKPDGQDHPEFSTQAAARYLADGTVPTGTYAEIPTQDDHRVRWIDKSAGRVTASGEKWVSPDGKTLSFTVDGTNQLYVYDRTGP